MSLWTSSWTCVLSAPTSLVNSCTWRRAFMPSRSIGLSLVHGHDIPGDGADEALLAPHVGKDPIADRVERVIVVFDGLGNIAPGLVRLPAVGAMLGGGGC